MSKALQPYDEPTALERRRSTRLKLLVSGSLTTLSGALAVATAPILGGVGLAIGVLFVGAAFLAPLGRQ